MVPGPRSSLGCCTERAPGRCCATGQRFVLFRAPACTVAWPLRRDAYTRGLCTSGSAGILNLYRCASCTRLEELRLAGKQRATDLSCRAESRETTANLVSVRISTQHQVSFGEIIRIVGAGPALGDWNPDAGPALTWSEGDNWSTELQVPTGVFDFKCVVVRQDGSIAEWEPGDNRTLEVPEGDWTTTMEVVCPWSDTSATFMSFDEDDMAARVGGGDEEQTEAGTTSTQAEIPPPPPPPSNGNQPSGSQPGGTQPSRETPSSKRKSRASGQSPGRASSAVFESQNANGVRGGRAAELVSSPSQASLSHKQQDELAEPAQWTAAVLGLLALPVVAWSEYTLRQTGCGLPPGPEGALGAVEGMSYIVVGGIFVWSFVRRIASGKGLGPKALMKLVEAGSYAAVIAGTAVLGVQVKEYGHIPAALPDAKCFGEGSLNKRQSRLARDQMSAPNIGEGISQLSGSVKASFQNVKDFLSGPQATLEELQSGAEDGLSSADLAPVVEELEMAISRLAENLSRLRDKVMPRMPKTLPPPAETSQQVSLLVDEAAVRDRVGLPVAYVAEGQPGSWGSSLRYSEESLTVHRQVNMDLGISTAATTAACAANNALQSMASAGALGLDHAPEKIDVDASLPVDAGASEFESSALRQEETVSFAGPEGEGHSEFAADDVVSIGPVRDETG